VLFKLVPPKFWYQRNIVSYALLPFSFVYRGIVVLRKLYYQFFPGPKIPIPVIVVGNITVGGTGKTPLVIYLAELLKSNGYVPGIVSRGYGGQSNNYPLLVIPESKVEEAGDEALLIARRTKCTVVVDPNRVAAAKEALLKGRCNVIISDDGLQHYALQRDVEIVVVDAELGFGNGFCLPAGPLREPPERLQYVDFIVKNYNMGLADDEYGMALEPVIFYNLTNPTITKKIDEFKGQTVHAFAGIGNPNKFFQTLRQLGLNVVEHPLPDHYDFQSVDDSFVGATIVVMTEKDAVKCLGIARENFWCLKVEAKLSNKLNARILEAITDHSTN